VGAFKRIEVVWELFNVVFIRELLPKKKHSKYKNNQLLVSSRVKSSWMMIIERHLVIQDKSWGHVVVLP